MLRARHLIGRSRLAHLRLHEPSISGEHAVLLWTGNTWDIHDLGSRNGTFVDGQRLEAGGRVGLRQGMTIGFGSAGGIWRLVDDGPPRALAVPVDGQSRARPRADSWPCRTRAIPRSRSTGAATATG